MKPSQCYRPVLILLLLSGLLSRASAQLPTGSIAPDFTFQDISGGTHQLYTYLNQGKYVAIDNSATWCVPCWSYHNQHVFDTLYQNYDIPGSQTMKVLFIEADGSTDLADLQGTGTSTQGNWIVGTPYPMIDPQAGAALTGYKDDYLVSFFPMFYLACPDKRVYHLPNNPSVADWLTAMAYCSTNGVDDNRRFRSFMISPNPATGRATLSFELRTGSSVSVTMRSADGRLVSNRDYGWMNPGHHSFEAVRGAQAPGIYFLTLSVNGEAATERLFIR